MSGMQTGLITATTNVVLLLLGITLLLAFVRLARGPTLPDRVIALDLVAAISVGIIAVYSVATRQPALLDAATVLALVTFLGTVAFARYLERRTLPWSRRQPRA